MIWGVNFLHITMETDITVVLEQLSKQKEMQFQKEALTDGCVFIFFG